MLLSYYVIMQRVETNQLVSWEFSRPLSAQIWLYQRKKVRGVTNHHKTYLSVQYDILCNCCSSVPI